ncbi:hypothetical protein [Gloeothece verrucosa]|uniref:Uncharacterized protein n=1 Tax=Gloeothece verrucosa (strain PCC 7822) TaxID=497965 RepID=E0UJ63_GLOV7|nr:hypothetical protein [Gloeothece verrucosa]ADN15766.1 hypothetical protein Cyan7822_3834 [Gloeothece verrucosa PCC 7822]
MGRTLGKKLATFELDPNTWDTFKKKAAEQGLAASTLLVCLVNDYLSGCVTPRPFEPLKTSSEVFSEDSSEKITPVQTTTPSIDDIRKLVNEVFEQSIGAILDNRLEGEIDLALARHLNPIYIEGDLHRRLVEEVGKRFEEALRENKKTTERMLNDAVASLEDSFIEEFEPLLQIVEEVLNEIPGDSPGGTLPAFKPDPNSETPNLDSSLIRNKQGNNSSEEASESSEEQAIDITPENSSEATSEKLSPTLSYLYGIVAYGEEGLWGFWNGKKFVEDPEKIQIFKRNPPQTSLQKAQRQLSSSQTLAVNYLDRILKHIGYPHLFKGQDTIKIAKDWADRNLIKE